MGCRGLPGGSVSSCVVCLGHRVGLVAHWPPGRCVWGWTGDAVLLDGRGSMFVPVGR